MPCVYSRNEVARRRRHRIIGTNHNDEHLQAAVKKAWLYIGKLKDTTTVDSLRKYIEKKGIAGDTGSIYCEELKTLGTNKAFRVGIDFQLLPVIEDPEFWPRGVLVRQFRFRRQPQRFGISLED